MKKVTTIAAIFTFVAAAIGLIVAFVYFLDRKGVFGGGEDDIDEVAYTGETEYFAEDIAFEPQPEEQPAAAPEEAPAE